MLKKALVTIVIGALVGSLGLFFWARSVLGRDTVRTALATQLSAAIGQPVTVTTIAATIYPRVTVNLGGVTIGNPARVTVQTVQVGTDLRALLSRRITHATLRVDGVRVQLPLPPFTFGATSATPEPRASPVEIVSIDEIVLTDVTLASGGRDVHADVAVVPHGNGLTVRHASLRADGATIDVTGEITDTAGPAGDLALKADTLDVDRLLAFVSAFSAGAVAADSASPPRSAPAPSTPSSMDLAVSLDTARATVGTLTLERLAGRARIAAREVTLEPVRFDVFGGRYDGGATLTLGGTPGFHLKASVSDVDMAAATAFAGSPDTITGRLSGRMDVTGRGLDPAAVNRSARGTVRFDVRNGTVRRLGLLRTIVLATSMRPGSTAAATGGSADEPFARLGATFAIANGAAATEDLQFDSNDLTLAAAGSLALNGSSVNLKGRVQLSDELTKQAGRDLVRYAQDQGRVTIPVEVTGSLDHLSPRVDVAGVAERAIRNRANEEVQKALKKGLKGLFR